jgi:hypothetical protein
MTLRQFTELLRDHYGPSSYPELTWIQAGKDRLCQMEMHDDPRQLTLIGAMILNIKDYVLWPWEILYCELFGHRMDVDTSYGGPESGYMGCGCSRCGCEWGNRIY